MRKLAHIVNPVIVKPTSDLHVAQPVTFETMKTAREFARGTVDVAMYSAQFPEDHGIVPPGIEITPDLERSILDFGTFPRPWKLPVMGDILERLHAAAPDAEYLVYTNVDIALMPNFYVSVNRIIDEGYDAFVVNRRTITEKYKHIKEIPLMYAEAGEMHEGHDLFVFRRDVFPKYKMGRVCLGVPWVGRVLIWNLICNARRFQEFRHLHLTFHIGNDAIGLRPENVAFQNHNKAEARKVMEALQAEYGTQFLTAYPLEMTLRLTPWARMRGLARRTLRLALGPR